MSEQERATTNTEPHLHSDMQLQDQVTRQTEVELPRRPGDGMLLMAIRLLRWWTWAAIVVAALAPLARWTWLGELAANCAAAVIVALLPGLALFRRERLSSLLICLAMLAAAWPWARQAYEERAPAIDPAGPPPFTVMVANTAYWNEVEPDVVADAILEADPDILVLVEVREDILRVLLQAKRWPRWHRSRARDELGPYSIAVASRFDRHSADRTIPVVGPARDDEELTEQGYTDITTVYLPVLELSQDTEPFLILAYHPPPPVRPRLWRHQAAVLEQALERLSTAEMPVLMAGDWNATPASAMWRAAYDQGLRRPLGAEPKSWVERGLGGLLPFCGLPIDRVAGRGFAMGPVQTLPIPGSDHRAVLVTVQRQGTAP